jgi:hypothetical protein
MPPRRDVGLTSVARPSCSAWRASGRAGGVENVTATSSGTRRAPRCEPATTALAARGQPVGGRSGSPRPRRVSRARARTKRAGSRAGMCSGRAAAEPRTDVASLTAGGRATHRRGAPCCGGPTATRIVRKQSRNRRECGAHDRRTGLDARAGSRHRATVCSSPCAARRRVLGHGGSGPHLLRATCLPRSTMRSAISRRRGGGRFARGCDVHDGRAARDLAACRRGPWDRSRTAPAVC